MTIGFSTCSWPFWLEFSRVDKHAGMPPPSGFRVGVLLAFVDGAPPAPLDQLSGVERTGAKQAMDISAQPRILFNASDLTWPTAFPLKKRHFKRQDESPDSRFYAQPRFVQHFGDAPRAALKRFYAWLLQDRSGVHVDICSSWVSHLPDKDVYAPSRIVGVGMNKDELKRNPRLDAYHVQDLNVETSLGAFGDASVGVSGLRFQMP